MCVSLGGLLALQLYFIGVTTVFYWRYNCILLALQLYFIGVTTVFYWRYNCMLLALQLYVIGVTTVCYWRYSCILLALQLYFILPKTDLVTAELVIVRRDVFRVQNCNSGF